MVMISKLDAYFSEIPLTSIGSAQCHCSLDRGQNDSVDVVCPVVCQMKHLPIYHMSKPNMTVCAIKIEKYCYEPGVVNVHVILLCHLSLVACITI